jgi:hypothetical protein
MLDDNDGKLTKRKQQRKLVFQVGGSYFTQATATEFPS